MNGTAKDPTAGSSARSKVYFTSSAVNGEPSCQVTPSRSLKTQDVPSSSQSVARSPTSRVGVVGCEAAEDQEAAVVLELIERIGERIVVIDVADVGDGDRASDGPLRPWRRECGILFPK